ncbi:MAG: adenylyltransferase/cytidyltransferase family protein [Tenuifilaceae bacterium]|jgi:glycerol-3-phosphate cytidylyltransferase|nr:adenylyltransferase/cytidyltransferase family protein [Tenuifilaceae bacterium]
MKNKNIIGYTSGVFDLFHIGHLNILKNAKSLCDFLVVGVTTDEVAALMKGKKPIIPFAERIEIVESIKFVDKAIAKTSTNNLMAFEEIHFNVFFKGDDWKNTPKGEELESLFKPYGVTIQYFPYTKHTSSSILRSILEKL